MPKEIRFYKRIKGVRTEWHFRYPLIALLPLDFTGFYLCTQGWAWFGHEFVRMGAAFEDAEDKRCPVLFWKDRWFGFFSLIVPEASWAALGVEGGF